MRTTYVIITAMTFLFCFTSVSPSDCSIFLSSLSLFSLSLRPSLRVCVVTGKIFDGTPHLLWRVNGRCSLLKIKWPDELRSQLIAIDRVFITLHVLKVSSQPPLHAH